MPLMIYETPGRSRQPGPTPIGAPDATRVSRNLNGRPGAIHHDGRELQLLLLLPMMLVMPLVA